MKPIPTSQAQRASEANGSPRTNGTKAREEPAATALTQPEAEELLLRLTDLLSARQKTVRDNGDGEPRRAEARYRALVEQIPAVTFMAALDGSASELYVSPQIEELLGFSAQEWLDEPFLWYRQLHPEDQARWVDDFARLLFGRAVPGRIPVPRSRRQGRLGARRGQAGHRRRWSALVSARRGL